MKVKTLIVPLAGMLLASVFGCASVRPPDLPPVREYTPDAERSVPGVEDESKKPRTRTYELYELKSKTKPVFKVILLEAEFDPESIRNWDVLLKPLSSLPAGGDGQALWTVVPFRDFKAWLFAIRTERVDVLMKD